MNVGIHGCRLRVNTITYLHVSPAVRDMLGCLGYGEGHVYSCMLHAWLAKLVNTIEDLANSHFAGDSIAHQPRTQPLVANDGVTS